ncbi:hypothetical protein [Alteromonas sp. BZK5]|mgnify:FL=1|uniref:hypothetical protein n=1 Tax=Alteromonas sp. BZK5 TaxID=1904459 RepID=UPI001653899D|nr:hypothetical protein [Alteromonas sp. BZK5]MBC6987075.1 hypothetical protein [Alteromonas sp. BZK5]MEC8963731.1 hypothetical protein [Pseudomonadota bacterium]MEC9163016.1 hypothetical protein [Pseudomonadota bacterium]
MKNDENLKLYEKMYLFEIERREKINARLNLPMAVIVAIFGLLSYVFNFDTNSFTTCENFVFYILLLFASISLFVACYHFKNCWSGLVDQYMPTAEDIEDYYQSLESTYAGFDEKEDLVKSYFNKFLLQSYTEYGSFNAKNNDYRSEQLYFTVRALSVSLFLALIATIVLKIMALT